MAKHALVIGINDYADKAGLTRLEWCIHDATAVAAVLESRGFAVTRQLTAEQTTREAIVAAVDRLVDDAGTDDVVVIYYAGHGSYGEQDGTRYETIVPSDSGRLEGPPTDIFDWKIDDWVRRLNRVTDNVTLIFDSCHSGGLDEVRAAGEAGVRMAPPIPAEAFDGGSVRLPEEPVPAARREATRGTAGWLPRFRRGSVVLAACDKSEVAKEYGDKQHGAFTYFLLEEIRELDAETTWRDLSTRIAYRLHQDGDFRQHPQVDGDGERVVFSRRRIERSPSLMVLAAGRREVTLSGGALDGVKLGSRWKVRSPGALHGRDGDETTTAEIRWVGLRTCTARVEKESAAGLSRHRAFPDRAFPDGETWPGSENAERLRELRNDDPGSELQDAVDHGSYRMRWTWRGRSKKRVQCKILLGSREEPSGSGPPVEDGAIDLAEAREGIKVDFKIVNKSSKTVMFTLLQITSDGEVGLLWPRTDHLAPAPGGASVGKGDEQFWSEYLEQDSDLRRFAYGVPLEASSDAPGPLHLLLVLSRHPTDLAFLELPDGGDSDRGGPDKEGDWAALHASVLPPAPAESRATSTAAVARGTATAANPPVEFDDLPLAVATAPAVAADGGIEKTIESTVFQARVQAVRRAARISPRSSGGGLLRRKDTAENRVRELGLQLAQALLEEDGFDPAPRAERGLRLRLAFDDSSLASRLAALPWEVLYRERDGTGAHLGLDPATPIVRSLARPRDQSSPAVEETPFRLLGMIAQPTDRPPLDAARERRLMTTAVQHLIDKGALELSWVGGETMSDLVAELEGGRWHAFHFIGHGGFDDEAYVAVASADGSSTRKVSASELAALFENQKDLRLVVLNSCKGAVADSEEQFSSFGPALEDRGIPAVVAMQAEISDRAAIHFSALLYEGIAAGLPIDAAVARARGAIAEDLAPTVEWVTPVLQLGSSDGKLLRPDINGAILRRVSGEDLPPGNLRGGIRRDWAETLRGKVRNDWVKKMLGAVNVRDASAASRWLERPGVTEQLDRPLGTLLVELEGSMVVLGPPGSGKTLTLYEVARDLLAVGGDEPPVPVLFPLSEWTRPGESLIDFLTVRMSLLYGVPKEESREWLNAGRLVLLLDGLDEIGAGLKPSEARELRNACAAAINALAFDTEPAGLVVSCGLKEYLELDDDRLAVRGAVRLETLTRKQLLQEVATGESDSELEQLLRRHPALQIQVRSPLWLSFLREIAPRLDDVAPELMELDTAGEIRDYLLDAYVDSCFDGCRREGSAP